MNTFGFLKNFAKDNSGAVTVDWVMLTAAVVGLGVAAAGSVGVGVEEAGVSISQQITSQVQNSLK